ncbi:hypothetical protein ACHAWO_010523 [Cyclotella atomus]|uniref:Uncharacterized protein n=1 Tax=Cyclotella atomus TaxID=382360 RepID=A0ABD3Q7W8_9STRA
MLGTFLFVLTCGLNTAAGASTITSFVPSTPSCHRDVMLKPRPYRYMHSLFASNDDKTSSSSTSKSARERGIYSRPSAAIERGSGFFIPGLEGPRIRLLFGITVLIADAASHFLAESQPGDVGQLIAESTIAFYGALLLFQGIIESGGQRNSQALDTSTDENGDVIGTGEGIAKEMISDGIKMNIKAVSSIRKAANTIIDFTPTKYVMLADKSSGTVYTLNSSNSAVPISSSDEQINTINLALNAVSESRGGRVALPTEHPVSKLLPPSASRCILVQKVNSVTEDQYCLILGSDSLLPSFTKNDLRWIGQLSETIKL